ncbi:MAG: hypothetical protein A3D31_11165 [Candidatus Fluviicola riflensis]|nr:MAG: hypothetical protein CHH17_15585 [Candidatus Fluviicola riflensis]OGS77550.1 MAG: hypothetical protein A3D31_11165 [Candidatus Fluviicola riflensis]OGS84131.1 MAG: hypothetical protein A3E30_12565 [Fluviicola sp. RIFCSPHIGHO2_12_FULL_43_24]OGS84616.1 MAG: hypothetical protein A2724_08100 [Fluviicola sp. RIFCSPHIGHO2_01_FULL_43_53]
MYKLILFLALCFSFSSKAQQSWKQVWTAPIDSTAVWDVDQAGNAYLVDKQTISKLDTAGKQLLTQSTKSMGTIAKIDASNWMKIAIFSEDQQRICYLDNALAFQPGCIDLAEFGVNLAQHFSTSAQTDRIWIYDQLNSELQLITIRNSQRQIVQNLASLVDLGTVLQLIEFQNKLYLFDNRGQVITLDNFGSFLSAQTVAGTHIQPFATGFLASDKQFIRFSDEETELLTPFFELVSGEEIKWFCFVGKRLFVSTATQLISFELIG